MFSVLQFNGLFSKKNLCSCMHLHLFQLPKLILIWHLSSRCHHLTVVSVVCSARLLTLLPHHVSRFRPMWLWL